ncbi:MAG TPA: protein kinase [Polyangiaceae bacterium]|nr:protein kinase [Polyangiaceae bacterium]
MQPANEAGVAEDATGVRKRFRPLIEIGRGGMAQVFLAESVSFDVRKLVVLKMLNDEFASHPEMRAAFRREADISARMNHPNVVQVFEVVEQAGQTLIVMEYLDGLPLSRVLRHVSLPLVLHLDVLSQVLGGLHHFHELQDLDDTPLNAVHRDVSPQNVLLLHDGIAKVLDFGVAKFKAGDPEHTRSGLIKGKIQYMPPEQLLGEAAIDRRADIFALGVMMWEALAARRLWKGLAERDVMRALARAEIPALREAAPDVAPELEAIVTRALQPNPDDRFQTAKEMQLALEEAMPATVGMPHSRELATFMHEHFGEARKQQKAKLDAARRNPNVDLVLDAYRPPSLGDATLAEPLRAPDTQQMAVPAEIVQPAAVPSAPPNAWKRRRLASASMLVLGVLALGYGLYRSRAVKPTAAVLAHAPVQFHVLTDPPEAEILLDGKLVGTGQYQSVQRATSDEHHLQVRAAGHVPKEESLRFDADIVRLIRLTPLPSANLTSTPGEAREKGRDLERNRPGPSLASRLARSSAADRREPVVATANSATTVTTSAPDAKAASTPAAETPIAPPAEPTVASTSAALAPTAVKETPVRAKQVSPKVGHARLAVNISADPYRVRLPPVFATALETLVKICVTTSGTVSSVSVVRSADPALDQRLMSTIPRWRYTPLLEDTRAIPFCYTVNLRFEASRN